MQVDIQRNCGSDNECIPDLQLTAKAYGHCGTAHRSTQHISIFSNKDTFTVGAVDNTLMLDVGVKNLFEDAYEAHFFITIPQGFEYSGIENKGKVGDLVSTGYH